MPTPRASQESEEQSVQPPWSGPPEAELGVCLPFSIVIGRSENAVIALRHATAYSTGVEFQLLALARGLQDRDARALMHEQHFDGGELPDGFLRVGLELADYSRVSNLLGRHAAQLEDDPDGPVLFRAGGSGGSAGGGRVTLKPAYWLWPLPLAGNLRMFVEWPKLAVPLSQIDLDADALIAAAAKSEQLWDR